MPHYSYSATRKGRHIIVSATDEEGRTSTLLWLKETDISHLTIRSERLCMLTSDFTGMKEKILVESSDFSAGAILNTLTRCIQEPVPGPFRTRLSISVGVTMAGLLAGVLAGLMLISPLWEKNTSSRSVLNEDTPPALLEPARYPAGHPAEHLTRQRAELATKPVRLNVNQPEASPVVPDIQNRAGTHDAEARKNLARVLKRNAERGMFTIALSSGHERTLHAFLDPRCPNCRLLEPALQELASEFNVLVWPVSIIGGEASSSAIAPLLCEEDAQKRIAGWQNLYAADAGTGLQADEAATPDASCLRAAAAAIDVNNVAFRQFGFAGTPWVISDTGWHLATGLLKSPGTVKLFLNTTDKGITDNEQTGR